jgi:hypothetical protein
MREEIVQMHNAYGLGIFNDEDGGIFAELSTSITSLTS